jgi:hypothetical protein
MTGHHLILGTLMDFITDQPVPDTHDERYRQKIARLLVTAKGYPKSSVTPGRTLTVRADEKCARVPVTYTITLDGRIAMIIQYGPGSLVTRHRPALAMGRLVASRQVPVVVVTNGEQADVLEGATGKVLASGLEGIPSRQDLEKILTNWPETPVSPKRASMEARIVMAFEVDDRCPCDDTVCTLSGSSGTRHGE